MRLLGAIGLAGALACGRDPVEPAPDSTCAPGGTAGAPLASLRGYIVFVANGQLGAVCPDGSDLRTSLRAVPDTGFRFDIDPSPDGRKILIGYGSTAGFDLFDVASGTLAPLDLPTTDQGVYHSDAVWSPDGSSIAYLMARGGLLMGDIAGTAVTNVRTLVAPEPPGGGPTTSYADLSWSRQGDRLAFVSTNLHLYAGYILVFDIGAGRFDGFQPIPETYVVRDPAWSPDGGRLAFIVQLAGPRQTWVAGGDGFNAAPLTLVHPPPYEASPSWSPDGSQVAVVRGGDLWIVPAAGGPAREVAHLPQPGIRRAYWVH